MVLKTIKGKKESPEIRKKNAEKKIEQMQFFISHMRTLENSIASVKTMAVKLEWDELNRRLLTCHKHVIDTLAFVKQSGKLGQREILELNKPKQKTNHLRIVEPSNDE